VADVTIAGWDKASGKNHAGVIKLLRDNCDLSFDQAHSLSLKLINDNATRRVSVPFTRREAFVRELQSRGFRVS
jgi:hypothetical protein